MELNLQRYQVKPNQTYILYKLHEDGTRELKGFGDIWMDTIQVGYGVIFQNWYTTPVDMIEKTGKGIIFETRNSTYLLEECNSLPGFVNEPIKRPLKD
jgi:hypothetical protein